MVLDKQLEVKAVNDSFSKFFKINPDEAVGRRVYELSNQWDVPGLQSTLEGVIKGNETVFKIERESRAGKKEILFNGRRFVVDDKGRELIMLAGAVKG